SVVIAGDECLAILRVAELVFGDEVGVVMLDDDGVRPYLPANAVVVEHYDADFVAKHKLGDPEYRKAFVPGNHHGRTMAQIVWATTGFSPQGPQFYLLNANGPTMLRRAVRYAIEKQVDVILFSGSFEGGGNNDGKGPINRIVDDAIAAGIVWINAVGNYGRHVYNGPVVVREDGFLQLTKGRDPTALRFRNLLDENTVTLTLTWNDYRDEEDAGTTKDLDLYIEDSDGRQLGSAAAVQVAGAAAAGPDQSRNPREKLVLTDLPGDPRREYLVRIRAKEKNFGVRDRLRLLLVAGRDEPYVDANTKRETQPLQFLDATPGGEVFPPADNPQVIAVGDAGVGSSVGPTEDGRAKPDVLLDESQAVFSNGESSGGSSNAAAYFAGIVATLKAAEPVLDRAGLLALASRWSTVRKSAEAPKGREITLKEARRLQPGVVDSVQKAIGIAALRAWQAKDKHLVLGVDRSPADLRSLFPQFPQDRLRHLAGDYDFFLALQPVSQGLQLVDFHRRARGAGKPEAKPWENLPGAQASDFVEIVYVPADGRAAVASSLRSRLWKTPSPVELKRYAAGAVVAAPVEVAKQKAAAISVPAPKPASKKTPPPPLPKKRVEG
ncbi:MAG TPA: hypothetical protein VNC50_23105, partial [Planctomycetia bacterium]|nr:hypothetical protein [Planctomycetia bacterium]